MAKIRGQNAPRRLQDAPKTAQEALRPPPGRPPDGPRCLQDAPETPQDAPRRSQDPPKTPQDAPKMPPRPPRTRPRGATKGAKYDDFLGSVLDPLLDTFFGRSLNDFGGILKDFGDVFGRISDYPIYLGIQDRQTDSRQTNRTLEANKRASRSLT